MTHVSFFFLAKTNSKNKYNLNLRAFIDEYIVILNEVVFFFKHMYTVFYRQLDNKIGDRWLCTLIGGTLQSPATISYANRFYIARWKHTQDIFGCTKYPEIFGPVIQVQNHFFISVLCNFFLSLRRTINFKVNYGPSRSALWIILSNFCFILSKFIMKDIKS